MRENAGDEFWLGDSNGPMGDVGAFMDSELRVDRADLAGHLLQLEAPRNLIAIVGAPGAGKSRLAGELAEALNAPGPCLIHATIDREQFVYPMVPPGAANTEMIGG